VINVERVLGELGRIVGDDVDRRWSKASLTLKGSDGVSRETFFNNTSFEHRLKLVTTRLTSGAAWSPLLLKDIPKGYGKDGTRPICWPTCVDTAVVYALNDIIEPHVEERLADVAVAYRKGRRMTDSIISAISKARVRGLDVVCVMDIKSFYDSIPWTALDRAIDSLPASSEVKALLKQLVRVDVHRVEDGSLVHREMGIPQGLGVSPLMANLALSWFDTQVAAAVGKIGCIVRRYADDIILLCPSIEAGEAARQVVRRQLGALGLRVKEGTGEVVDLAQEGTSATWLGIRLRGHKALDGSTVMAMDVPDKTIRAKAVELKGELEAGFSTPDDLEERLEALQRYWEALMPKHKARRAVEAIRDEALGLVGLSPLQSLKKSIEMISMESTKKEEKQDQTRTIEEMIYPSTRTPRTSRDEDETTGKTVRMTLRVGRSVEIKKQKKQPLSTDALSASRGLVDGLGGNTRNVLEDDGLFSGSTPSTSATGTGRTTPVGVQGSVQGSLAGGDVPPSGASAVAVPFGLRLSRSDGPCIATGRDGMPAVLHPIRSWKRIVVIRAKAKGSKAVLLQIEINGILQGERVLHVPKSHSNTEAVLTGFERVLGRLDLRDGAEVQLVTNDTTITGYMEKGWRVGSFRVLKRLRALQRFTRSSTNTTLPAPRRGDDIEAIRPTSRERTQSP
jgi:retron-type reverse transcriptase